MSLHLEFEPHSWYKGWAIRDNLTSGHDQMNLSRPLKNDEGFRWSAYTDNGMTGYIVERHADTLKDLYAYITLYENNERARIARLYRDN